METAVIRDGKKIILRTFLGNGECIDQVLYEDTTWSLDDYLK